MFVRRAVFIDEQSVPAELEIDGLDDRCLHALALVGEKAVGTAASISKTMGRLVASPF